MSTLSEERYISYVVSRLEAAQVFDRLCAAAEKLKPRRRTGGLTLERLADAAGMSLDDVHAYMEAHPRRMRYLLGPPRVCDIPPARSVSTDYLPHIKKAGERYNAAKEKICGAGAEPTLQKVAEAADVPVWTLKSFAYAHPEIFSVTA